MNPDGFDRGPGRGEREEDRLVLLMLGRDDLLLLAYLNSSAICRTMTSPYGEMANPSGSVPLEQDAVSSAGDRQEGFQVPCPSFPRQGWVAVGPALFHFPVVTSDRRDHVPGPPSCGISPEKKSNQSR